MRIQHIEVPLGEWDAALTGETIATSVNVSWVSPAVVATSVIVGALRLSRRVKIIPSQCAMRGYTERAGAGERFR